MAERAGLRLVHDAPFDPALFPGYRHRTTLADAKDAVDGRADVKHMRTLCFKVDQGNPPPRGKGPPPPTVVQEGGAAGEKQSEGRKARVLSALEAAMAAHVAGSKGSGGGGLGLVKDTRGSGISKKRQQRQKQRNKASRA